MNYAQLDKNNVCHTVSDYNTGIVATIDNLGQRYVDGAWEAVPQSATQLREAAYRTLRTKEDSTPLISYSGATYTCDEAYTQIKVYEQEDQFSGTTKAQELGQRWVAGKEYIRQLYPAE